MDIYFVLKILGTTTWWPGDGWFFSGACVTCYLVSHILIWQRWWNVYFEIGMEGGILSYSISLEFPAHWKLGGISKFLNIYLLLWHQLWCQFGVSVYYVYVDLRGFLFMLWCGIDGDIYMSWSCYILNWVDEWFSVDRLGGERLFHHQDEVVADFIVTARH